MKEEGFGKQPAAWKDESQAQVVFYGFQMGGIEVFFITAMRACNHRDLGDTGAACQLCPSLLIGLDKSQFLIVPPRDLGSG